MPKTILTVLGAVLLTASTVQMAAASEHHARKTPTSQQFHNANNSAIWSAQPGGYNSAGPGGYNTGR